MKQKNSLKNVERRDFLKILSLSGIGSLIYSKKTISSVLSPNAVSDVVVVTDENATDKTTQSVNYEIVKNMVDSGIKIQTGIHDVGEAWKSVLTGVYFTSIIGIKVNTLFSTKNTGTHPQVVRAVTEGLAQMDFGGTKFPENNIILYDFHSNYLTKQGYTLNETTEGVRCFPTSSYSNTEYDVGDGILLKLSSILSGSIDYLINVAYLKQHFLSGVSLCLKNHYGSVHDPEVDELLHDNTRNGSPYIAAISNLQPVKSKQKFCIIDGLYGLTSGGPGGPPTCNPNKIIMGQDIVAVDTIGKQILVEYGLSASEQSKAKHIHVAASDFYLGTDDLDAINRIDIDPNTTGILTTDNKTGLFQNAPNPFSETTEIKFFLKKQEHIQIKIYSYSGRLVNQLINKGLEPGEHSLFWNGSDKSGKYLPAGIYLCELKSDSYNKSIVMQKIK